jgi:hypothetical protein
LSYRPKRPNAIKHNWQQQTRARSSLCAQQTGFAERSVQKIVLQRQLSDLGMQRLHVDSWLRGSLAAAGTEHIGCPFLELRLPRCDLIGVDVELLRKLSQFAPFGAASATFALKVGVWFRRGRLFMVSPDSLGTACPLSGRNSTYRPVQISETSS